ncbi:MAG: hypothetical protein FWD61_07985 [Phycisphaerales bacterium]|nr:hypothetical protein [Phycisphaerales bacterium]
MSLFPSAYRGGSDSNANAARAASEAAAAGRSAREVEDRLERLTLICRAMWELLREKGIAVEEELIAKMAIIDAADGVADGKQTEQIHKCPKCGRTLQRRATKCLYCNAEYMPTSVFETI